MFSKDEIYKFICKDKPTFLKIAKRFNVPINKNKELSNILNSLKKEKKIFFSKKDDIFYAAKYLGEFTGIYKINFKNIPYSIVDIDGEKKVNVFNNKNFIALKDDEILMEIFYDTENTKYVGFVKEIKSRKNQFIIAEIDNDLNVKPIYLNQNINLEYSYDCLEPDTYAKFKIDKIFKDKLVLVLDKIIAKIDKPYSDIDAIVEYSNVKSHFSTQILNDAKSIPKKVENISMFNRKDLRDEMIVTIDGKKTKDFDDAISVEKINDNQYKLGVHIADVAFYVKEDSEIDKEARERGTSIYLIDKVIPMLPEELSNGICSLVPNEDRFTISLEAIINQQGNVLETKIFPSLINSKYRLTYDQVANMDNDEIITTNKRLHDMLQHAYELSDILSNKKNEEGYIDFEIAEPIIELNELGRANKITLRKRLSSEILIENFMVFANETVSKMISDMSIPSIYRVHKEPTTEKFDALKSFLKIVGLSQIKVKNSKNPKEFQVMVQKLKVEKFDNLVKMALLKTMQKAEYSIDNVGHFGLASKYYSHFTSPIRRYPDLLLHRIIWEVIFKGNKEYSKKNKQLISDIAKKSSNSELKAVELERKVNDVKKAEYYSSMINEIFEATIVSIQKFGIFVEFDDLTSSLVHISTIINDNEEYKISEDMYRMITKNKIYQIGQKVKVKIVSTNSIEGKIDSIFV